MTALPTLTVIIPSYNGAHRILHTLDAVAAQTDAPQQVIVVLDGSTDGSEALLRARAHSQALHLVVQANAGRAAARNRGASEATGDVLLFLDDDMRPLPDAVQRHRAFHAAHAHSVLIGSQQTEAARYPTELGAFHCYMESRYLGTAAQQSLHCMPATQDYITAAHLSMARSLFAEMGGFDAQLSDLEDFDLAMRLHDQGHRIWRDESLLAWHDNVQSPQQLVRRQRQYYTALDRLHSLKPELTARRQARTRKAASLKQRLKFWPLAQPVLLRRFGKWPLSWLPRSLRFRLYEYMIFGLVNYYPHRKL